MLKNLCLKTPRKKAEFIRKKLFALGILDHKRKIVSDAKNVYLPIKNSKTTEAKKFGRLTEKRTKTQKREPRSIATLLRHKLTKRELALLKSSYDSFGEVVVVEVPKGLVKKEKMIGQAFLNLHKKLRAVFKKTGPVTGDYRTRKLKRIAGTGGSETTYKEHGCTFQFDLTKVFFSPRLATERDIIARQVKPKEVVVDMFAGAGPFSILIAKKQPLVKKIYAIDLNPDAVRYLKLNSLLNKVGEKIEAISGDAPSIINKKLNGTADRVIMNLPRSPKNYLPTALKALKKKGVLHYYTFCSTEEEVRQRIGESLRGKTFRIRSIRNVKPYSPEEYCFAADIYISKK